jgi:polyisoprenoid-binding protein YceI
MKKIMMIALTALATSGFAQMKDGKYIVDYKGSMVNWRGENLTGGGHDGTVAISSGNVVVMKNNIASGRVKINMNEMTCTDIKDPGTNSKLINHLKAEDFFNTAQYPDANFEITNCSPAKGNNGTTHQIKGKLTVKGISQEIAFPVKIESEAGSIHVVGDLTFDRSLFNVKYPSAGEYAAKNEVKMKFDLKAKI